MARYTEEQIQNILKDLTGPDALSIPKAAAKHGVSAATLYKWQNRNNASQGNLPLSPKATPQRILPDPEIAHLKMIIADLVIANHAR